MTHTITQETWEELYRLACDTMTKAYVPYSGYRVGAACLSETGQYFSGCNVENAGYGVTLCAECGLVSDLVRHQGGKIRAFCCVNNNKEYIVPCGRCRQLLAEHCAPGMLLRMPTGIMTMDEVLPGYFNNADLDRATDQSVRVTTS